MTTERDRLIDALHRSREYREALWEENITAGIAVQLRELREGQRLTQERLGELAGMAQARIHEVEDPEYGRWSTTTLKRLAKALGVVLDIRFISYGEFVERILNLSPESLNPPAFNEDPRMKAHPKERQIRMELHASALPESLGLPFNVTPIGAIRRGAADTTAGMISGRGAQDVTRARA